MPPLVILMFGQELLPIYSKCSASIQRHSSVDFNPQHGCVVTRNTVSSFNVQLEAK
jgi:hypothetical protein